jgi:pyruvate/2-oxoglutarate dehydrogenase complex dihydrolipoamide acyltransferase (E2) component
VHDPNAETRCLAVRVGRYLANLISSSASAATAKTTAAPAPAPAATTSAAAASASAATVSGASVGPEIRRRPRRTRRHREPNVRVATPGDLALGQRDVGQTLEFRLEHPAGRRCCNDLRNQVARIQRGHRRRSAYTANEIST